VTLVALQRRCAADPGRWVSCVCSYRGV